MFSQTSDFKGINQLFIYSGTAYIQELPAILLQKKRK